MENFESIHDVLYRVHTDVIRRKKSPILAILLAVVGIVLTVWSVNTSTLEDHENLSSFLMIAGIVLTLVGGIMTVRAFGSSVPYYRPTGERLYRSERFFEQKDKRELCTALESGQVSDLVKMSRSDTSGVVLTLYGTRSGSFILAQVAEYIPHRFVPITTVVSFTQEEAKIIRSLA